MPGAVKSHECSGFLSPCCWVTLTFGRLPQQVAARCVDVVPGRIDRLVLPSPACLTTSTRESRPASPKVDAPGRLLLLGAFSGLLNSSRSVVCAAEATETFVWPRSTLGSTSPGKTRPGSQEVDAPFLPFRRGLPLSPIGSIGASTRSTDGSAAGQVLLQPSLRCVGFGSVGVDGFVSPPSARVTASTAATSGGGSFSRRLSSRASDASPACESHSCSLSFLQPFF